MEFKLTDEFTDYVLRYNEGYRETASFVCNEYTAQNHYLITDGKLYCHTLGDTIDETFVCNPRKTKMFLRTRRSLIYSALQSKTKGTKRFFISVEEKGAIREAIRIYHDEMNQLPSDIVYKIMARFSLERSEAEKYVEETLGLQPV